MIRRAPTRAVVSVAVACTGLLAGPAAVAQAATPSLSKLSLAQLAGQRVIYSYPGLEPPKAIFDRIRAGTAGGVIFFGANVDTKAQITAVVKRLQAARLQSPVKTPLLIMTDQEGGLVRRLPGAPGLSEKQVGAARDSVGAARAAGKGAGNNLRGAGINLNLAPVLGVYRQSGDFLDQFGRSYSRNASKVARLGATFIAAQQRTGVAATAKHFPGLGAATANQNTDEGPVTIRLSKTTLRAVDEMPYPSAIEAGVNLVMTSWAIYPALDAGRPAGLSSKIIQGELRDRLGFRGVTITDAIEAGALQRFGGIKTRSILAARAGMDVLLYSARDPVEGTRGLDALASALRNGRLSRVAFQASVERVLDLRTRLGTSPSQPLSGP